MAAGLGTRMKSATPKHLHPLLGRRMVDWVIDAARALGPDPLVVVTSPESAGSYDGLAVVVQRQPLGTGDAVRRAREAVGDGPRSVLVLSGDTPGLKAETLRRLAAHHTNERAAATVLTFRPPSADDYGRIVRDRETGDVTAIVEAKDATAEQLEIGECNSSIFVFDAARLWPALERLSPVNAQGELYLTDAVRVLVDAGDKVAAFEGDWTEAEGVNTREGLAKAAAVLRDRINAEHMDAGVTIVDPGSTWIDPDVELEADATIHPFTVLRGKTKVAAGAEVGPHVVAIDAEIGADATVGPFCYLRPGTKLGAGAKAGTFVEMKNADVGARTKVPHLSYIGDAEIGDDTNVAAGNITANFPHEPGRPKSRTKIGRNVRTGIHNGFEAPVEIGDDAWIAGGAYITEDVPPESLAGFPPRQITKEGYLRGKRND
ncbi:MAG: bifunctional UDP-N-acetylglucosamine diphosphorylase/glucosamine-1-phosphate N-acetyltransferase GlmU [Gaiellaceae bacterium]